MIGDVEKAEKLFNSVVDRNARNIIKGELYKKNEGFNADNLVNEFSKNKKQLFENNILNNKDDLNKIIGKNGVVDRLSTRPHTTSKSNFIKFVKNEVNDVYFIDSLLYNPLLQAHQNNNPDELLNSHIKKLEYYRERLKKYLDASERENRKHKDVAAKLDSKRKANRLKVLVTAYILALIAIKLDVFNDYRQKNLEDTSKSNVQQQKNDAPPLPPRRGWTSGVVSEDNKNKKPNRLPPPPPPIPNQNSKSTFIIRDCDNPKLLVLTFVDPAYIGRDWQERGKYGESMQTKFESELARDSFVSPTKERLNWALVRGQIFQSVLKINENHTKKEAADHLKQFIESVAKNKLKINCDVSFPWTIK